MANDFLKVYPLTKALSQELSDSIPIEIYEYIIAHMDSTSALKNCSLTCRAWLQASWKNIFSRRRIVVDCNNCEAFLQLIELDRHSVTIIRFIRSLHIEQGDSRLLFRSTGPRNPKTFQFDDFLPRFVGLVSVKTLRLGWIRRDIGPTMITSLRTNFGQVTVLELNSVVLVSTDQLLDILISFPSLTNLTLVGVAFSSLSYSVHEGEQTFFVERTLPVPPKLNELSCNLPRDETVFIFSWLTAHGVSSIQRLNVTLIHESSNAAISRYLRKFGSTLEELTIGSFVSISPEAFDLSPCTKLSMLVISVQFRFRSSAFDLEVPPSDLFVPLFSMLQTVSAERLREVKIFLRPNGDLTEEDYNHLDWNGLAFVIKQPQFTNLSRFRLIAPYKHVELFKRVIKKQIWEEHPLLASVVRVGAWGRPKRIQ
ncbi:hypothetical protein GGU11DRAFT_748640 [Lentinula aff. detonsa]|nr:hypothetical protein GGU11DRAFT_748640 [Lentinula aff. detonsa]